MGYETYISTYEWDLCCTETEFNARKDSFLSSFSNLNVKPDGYYIVESMNYAEPDNVFDSSYKSFDLAYSLVADFLAPISEGRLLCTGDDSDDLWCIEFGEGKWKMLTGHIYYGDLLDNTIRVYRKYLPPDLIQQLIDYKATVDLVTALEKR